MTLLITALDVLEAKHRYARRHAAPVDESMCLHNALNNYLCPDKSCACHDLETDALDRWEETLVDMETCAPDDAGADFAYSAANGYLFFYDTTPPERPRTIADLVTFISSLTLEESTPAAHIGWAMGYAAGLSENYPNRFWTSDPAPEQEVQS